MSKQIIVGIDIRDLKVAKTGQKTTLEELCKGFRKLEGPEFSFRFLDSSTRGYDGKNKFLLAFAHVKLHWWKQVVLPYKAWKNNCDIIFCADYFVPYFHFGYRTVQVFHDAFFYEYPEHYNRLWMYLFKYLSIPAARRSAYIVVPTQYAMNRVQHFTGFPREKFAAIYEGPKTLPPAKTQPEWLRKLEGQKFILHVGVMEKRKNLPALVRAFKKLQDDGFQDYRLVLVGQGSGKLHSDDHAGVLKAIRETGLQDKVVLPGYVPDEELSAAYSGASLYVFPSYNEGFGIPILEAFRFSLPVIVADNSCLPEVGGNAVITFDPRSDEDICEKMKMVLSDEKLRHDLIEKGRERLKMFTWDSTCRNLTEIFKRALVD